MWEEINQPTMQLRLVYKDKRISQGIKSWSEDTLKLQQAFKGIVEKFIKYKIPSDCWFACEQVKSDLLLCGVCHKCLESTIAFREVKFDARKLNKMNKKLLHSNKQKRGDISGEKGYRFSDLTSDDKINAKKLHGDKNKSSVEY